MALLSGAFEYQGKKCSACSRAYVPRSLWPAVLLTRDPGTDFRYPYMGS